MNHDERTKGFRCFECNAPANHAHHVVPFSLGGTRTVPLCETCHGKVHGVAWKNHGALIRTGLDRAKAQGKRLGRPQVSADVERKVLKARAEGKGMLRIAREVGVGSGTVQRILAAKS